MKKGRLGDNYSLFLVKIENATDLLYDFCKSHIYLANYKIFDEHVILKSYPKCQWPSGHYWGWGGCISHAGLTIAASSYIRSMILVPLPMTTFICIDYHEKLVDSPGSLMLRYDIFSDAYIHTYTIHSSHVII